MNEKQIAQMEGERNGASDSYFEPRSHFDTGHARKIFEAGFERAYKAEPDPGYYVHWDKIVEKVGDAIGDRGYCQSPMELITTLIDQRDEALEKAKAASA